jgi:hypothetical protein
MSTAVTLVALAAMFCSCGGGEAASTTPTSSPSAAGPHGPIDIATFSGNGSAVTSAFHVDTPRWSLGFTIQATDCKAASALILVYDSSHPNAFIRNIPITGCSTDVVSVPFGPSEFFLKINVNAPTVSYNITVSEVR